MHLGALNDLLVLQYPQIVYWDKSTQGMQIHHWPSVKLYVWNVPDNVWRRWRQKRDYLVVVQGLPTMVIHV